MSEFHKSQKIIEIRNRLQTAEPDWERIGKRIRRQNNGRKKDYNFSTLLGLAMECHVGVALLSLMANDSDIREVNFPTPVFKQIYEYYNGPNPTVRVSETLKKDIAEYDHLLLIEKLAPLNHGSKNNLRQSRCHGNNFKSYTARYGSPTNRCLF